MTASPRTRTTRRRFRVAAAVAVMGALILLPVRADAHSTADYYGMKQRTETAHQHCQYIILYCTTHAHPVDTPNYIVGSGWGGAQIARLQDGLTTWNNTPTAGAYFKFTYNGAGSQTWNSMCAFNQPGQNGHLFQAIDGPGNTSGWTDSCTTDGEFISSFMVSYDSGESWYTGTGTPTASQGDLLSVVVHELGHATGFDGPYNSGHFNEADSAVCPDPYTDTSRHTMCPFLALGSTWPRSLAPHDIETFCKAYIGLEIERACP